jgi:hypothetical protein
MKKSILFLGLIVFLSSCSLLKKQKNEEVFDTEVRATFYVNRPVVEDTTLYTLVYYKYGNDTIHIYEKNNSVPKDTKYFKVIRVENNVRSRHWP